jgi:hypothetical protein
LLKRRPSTDGLAREANQDMLPKEEWFFDERIVDLEEPLSTVDEVELDLLCLRDGVLRTGVLTPLPKGFHASKWGRRPLIG